MGMLARKTKAKTEVVEKQNKKETVKESVLVKKEARKEGVLSQAMVDLFEERLKECNESEKELMEAQAKADIEIQKINQKYGIDKAQEQFVKLSEMKEAVAQNIYEFLKKGMKHTDFEIDSNDGRKSFHYQAICEEHIKNLAQVLEETDKYSQVVHNDLLFKGKIVFSQKDKFEPSKNTTKKKRK